MILILKLNFIVLLISVVLRLQKNQKKYSKMIKRILERKGYWFFDSDESAAIEVELSELQGASDFLNINRFIDVTIDFENDGYIETSSRVD